MIDRKKRLIYFFTVNIGLLCVALFLVWLGRFVAGTPLALATDCPSHIFFDIYCPFCGGTRAVGALLTGDLVGALRVNAAVVLSLPLLIWADVRALVRILGKKPASPLLPLHPLIPILLFAAFFVLRNVLLLFGIDPTGDFLEQLKNIK